MLTALLVKYSKSIIDVLIVLGIVIAVVIINPFNIFNGGGIKLNNTANNISSIKEIGELVTAEYYGEVISSYGKASLNIVEEEDVTEDADLLFRELKQFLLKIHLENIPKSEEKEEKKERRNIFSRFIGWVSSPPKSTKAISNKVLKTNFDDFYSGKSELEKQRVKELLGFYFDKRNLQNKSNNAVKRWMLKLFEEVKSRSISFSESSFNNYMMAELPDRKGSVFSDYHYEQNKKKCKKCEEKPDDYLSMIGRGWVKAGIDFGIITKDNLVLDKGNRVVHLYGVYPKILDKDINPWFIPEKRVPGFQILESSGKADFYDAVKVKKNCIDKLEYRAIEAGILTQAEEQAKESIKSFIGLLTETEIKEVFFHNDDISKDIKEIVQDKFINFKEGLKLDTLIQNEIKHIKEIDTTIENWHLREKEKTLKTDRLKGIISKVKTCYYVKRPRRYTILSTLDTILNDNVIDEKEYLTIVTKKRKVSELLKASNFNSLDTLRIWYGENGLDYISDYNDFIERLEKGIKQKEERGQEVYWAKSIEDYYKSNDELEVFMKEIDTTADKILYRTVTDSGKYLKVLKEVDFNTLSESGKIVNRNFGQLKYEMSGFKNNWKEIIGGGRKSFFSRNDIDDLKRAKDDIKKKDSLKLNEFFVRIKSFFPDDRLLEVKEKYKIAWDEDQDSWKIPEENLFHLNLSADSKAVINYILDYYIKESERFSWFTRASEKVKTSLDTENVNYLNNSTTHFLDNIKDRLGIRQ